MTNTQKLSPERNQLTALQQELKRVTETLIKTQNELREESERRNDLELIVSKYLNESNGSLSDNNSESGMDDEIKQLREILAKTKNELNDMYVQKNSIEHMLQKYLEGFGSIEAVSRFTSFIELNPEAVVALDVDGLVLEWNPAAENIFGWKKEEIIGKSYPIVSDVYMDSFKTNHKRVMNGEVIRAYETVRQTKRGELLNVSVSSMPLKNEEGKIIGSSTIITDLTAFKKRANLANRLATVVEQSPNMILITDKNHIIEYINQSMLDSLGYTAEELIGEKASILKSEKTPENTFREMKVSLEKSGTFNGEIINKKKSGEHFPVSCLISPLRDEDGEITHWASIQEDLTEIKKLKKELYFKSHHDSLTGLFNENAFKNSINELVKKAKQEDTEHALAIIDLDDFELINTNCGLKAGDALVKKTAKVLKSKIHGGDIIARVGRDKFGLLMQYCTLQQAQQKIDSIREKIYESGFKCDEQTYNITASVGIVSINKDSELVETIVENAEIACNKAKQQGKNRSMIFSESHTDVKKRLEEMDMAARILNACDKNELFLLWQSIIPVNNDEEKNCIEVHVNMHDENGETIGGEEFLYIAEKYGVSTKIDLWVIRKAIGILEKHKKRILDQARLIVINLSSKSVCDINTHEYLLELLDDTDIPLSTLCFEIEEKVALSHLPEIRHFMYALKNRGCSISIEKFGARLSSFSYLQKIPFDYIKIDRSFVNNLVDDEMQRVFIKSIHDICQSMNKKTIAEFIDDENVVDILKKMGINYIQGSATGVPALTEKLLQ